MHFQFNPLLRCFPECVQQTQTSFWMAMVVSVINVKGGGSGLQGFGSFTEELHCGHRLGFSLLTLASSKACVPNLSTICPTLAKFNNFPKGWIKGEIILSYYGELYCWTVESNLGQVTCSKTSGHSPFPLTSDDLIPGHGSRVPDTGHQTW